VQNAFFKDIVVYTNLLSFYCETS